MVSLVLLGIIILLAIFADVLFDKSAITTQNIDLRNCPPSWEHWFGTDLYGRDIFIRMVFGSRVSLHIVILFHTPVVASGALFPEGPGGGDGAVANDGLVVVLNDHIVPGVQPDVRSVDFPSGVFIHFWNEIRSSTRGQCMCCCRLRSMSPECRESRLCPSAQRPYPAA